MGDGGRGRERGEWIVGWIDQGEEGGGRRGEMGGWKGERK